MIREGYRSFLLLW